MLPFVLLAFVGVAIFVDDWTSFLPVIVTCMLVALAHIFSYAPRSGLRAAGYAWMEAWTKVIERLFTMSGYLILYYIGSNSVESYALAFLLGALIGLFSALMFARRALKTSSNKSSWEELGECWIDNKSLILQSLPFAITFPAASADVSFDELWKSGLPILVTSINLTILFIDLPDSLQFLSIEIDPA